MRPPVLDKVATQGGRWAETAGHPQQQSRSLRTHELNVGPGPTHKGRTRKLETAEGKPRWPWAWLSSMKEGTDQRTEAKAFYSAQRRRESEKASPRQGENICRRHIC